MMERILEPLLMTDPVQCNIFAESERGYIRTLFVDSLMNKFNLVGTILDLGSGPCDYDIEICKRNSNVNVNILAVDASEAMTDIANQNVKGYNIKTYCDYFENIEFQSDITISSLTLHHQIDPIGFWNIVKQNTKKNGKIFIMDMIRPNNYEDINKVVSSLADKENEVFITDFKNSLAASFTVSEIQEQLKESGLNLVTEVVGKLGVIVLIYGENI